MIEILPGPLAWLQTCTTYQARLGGTAVRAFVSPSVVKPGRRRLQNVATEVVVCVLVSSDTITCNQKQILEFLRASHGKFRITFHIQHVHTRQVCSYKVGSRAPNEGIPDNKTGE